MTGTLRRLAVLLFALALVASACGDDDDGLFTSTTADDGATTTTAGDDDGDDDGTTTTAGDDEGDDDGTTTTAGGGDGGDIADLIERSSQVPLRATYLFGQDADEQVVVLSQDPDRDPPASALIILEGGPDSAEEGRILTVGDQTMFCGPPEPGNVCIPSPPGTGNPAQAILGPFFGFLLMADDITDNPAFDIDEAGATIAGRDARCFTFSPSAALGADVEFLRQCIDAELGFTMLIEGRDAGGDTVERYMELVEYGDPRPEDFEPTGEMMDVPTG